MIYNLIRTSLFDLEDESELCYNNPSNCPENEQNLTFDFSLEEAQSTKQKLEYLYGADHMYVIKPK